MFYTREENGIPADWMERVRASMATLTPQFSSERMVRQYVDELYAPAAAAYRTRLADHCRVGSDVQRWRDMIASYWSDVSFGALHVERPEPGTSFASSFPSARSDRPRCTCSFTPPPGRTMRPNGSR